MPTGKRPITRDLDRFNPRTPIGSGHLYPGFPEKKKPTRTAVVLIQHPLLPLSSSSLLSPAPLTSAAMRTQVVSALIRARPSTVSRVTPRLVRLSSNGHHQETFESFTERYVNFFQSAEDLFEVQRGLNNCFAHDLVPAPAVVESALRASRRVNDYATAVRVFEGIKEKVENKAQYQAYLDELKPVREELGVLFVSRRVSSFPLSFAARSGIDVKEELFSS